MTDAIDPISLIERIERLNEDEREVLFVILDRLEMGRANYGPLDLEDGRDWEAEWLDEAIDGFAYAAMRTVQIRRRRSGPWAP